MWRAALLSAALAAATAVGASPAPADEPINASRASGPIHVDGRLDEAAWNAATPFERFVEIYPDEGKPARFRTSVRVLYDNEYLYVGIVCEDPEPDRIVATLARRDHIPASDVVAVAVDPSRDGRNGYYFAVNAAGVVEDRLLYDDSEETSDWDAVWEGAAARLPNGWSAELAIPLSTLRGSSASRPYWGIYVQRKVARTHQVFGSVLIPTSADAFVSRFGLLHVGPIEARRRVQLAPFAVARATLRPQFSDPAHPVPRLLDPTLDVGLDLQAPLGNHLVLNGTVNPDFGQVEADPVILNLSRFEPSFPEKRPFFFEAMQLFEPVGGTNVDVPQQAVYTRRIGLTSPILGAAKVTGELRPGLQAAFLDAFVAGASAPADEAHPDRRIGLHLSQPFHLGPNDALPTVAPLPRNYFAGSMRELVGRSSAVGLKVAAASPIGPACTEAEAAASNPPPWCDTPGGEAAALEWILRTGSGDYGFVGQAVASHASGGPPVRVLPDGTHLLRGDSGLGTYFTIGKTGGEPWRLSLSYAMATPTLDLNATGYQPDQNLLSLASDVRWIRPRGIGRLRAFAVHAHGGTSWTDDRRTLTRGYTLRLEVLATTPRYVDVSCDAGWEDPRFDIREVVGAGVAYEKAPAPDAGCSIQTSLHEPVSAALSARVLGVLPRGALPGALGWRARASVALRSAEWNETRLSVDLNGEPVPGRFVALAADQIIFGDLASRTLSVKLRQQVIMTPRLTLEGYAQLFTSYGRYGRFYASALRPVIHAADLRVTAAPAERPDFRTTSLRVNVVLRWEYRLGSALYVVYTRAADQAFGADTAATLAPALPSAPTTDVFLVKLSFWEAR